MSDAKLARVKIGVNKRTFAPLWYVEARLSPKHQWLMVVDKGKWLTHRTERAAARVANDLNKRLRAKLELSHRQKQEKE